MAKILRSKMRIKPSQKRVMYQEWRDLLFVSWKYEPDEIQKTLPPGLFVDTFEGSGYITIVPFKIQNFSIANIPSVPVFSDFLEVNVRTYVYDKNDLPGIWFYSLDINSMILAKGGREFFSLPYHFADLTTDNGKEIQIKGKRSGDKTAEMQFSYQTQNKTYKAESDTLDFFLLERYALFAFDANQLYIQRIHHLPYLLSHKPRIKYDSNLFEINSLIPPSTEPDHACYSPGVDVEFFPLKKDPAFQ